MPALAMLYEVNSNITGRRLMLSNSASPTRSLVFDILDERRGLDLRAYDEPALRHVVDVGLGPLLYRLARDGAPHPWHAILRTQDLAARVESMSRLDALEEILTAAPASLAGEILLLKGMSLCQRLYPETHLRMMGDIDLLVASARQPELEDVMRSLGYVQQSPQLPEFYDSHHHSMPFRHSQTGIIVEVHSALFRPQSPLGCMDLFRPGSFLGRSLPGRFRGFSVRHLDEETELAYLATHWINERRFFGTAVIPVVDIALRLRQLPEGFGWDRLLATLENSAAAPHVRIALTYLCSRMGSALPAEVVQRLASLSGKPGPVVDPWLHRLIDRHALAGKPYGVLWSRNQVNVLWEALMDPRSGWLNLLSIPWRLLFPPGQVRRFHPGFHWQRLRSAIRRLLNGR